MGIRIYAYAVDLAEFGEFLKIPLSELVRRYQRDGRDSSRRLTFTWAHTDDTVSTTPGGSIMAWVREGSKREMEILTEERLQNIPMFQARAREHLSNDNYQSWWLLGAFSNCNGIEFIAQLIDGHRRWWIGSVLQSARRVLANSEYEEVKSLFRKILRGGNCGYDDVTGDVGVDIDDLPFSPEDDPYFRFGRWTEKDIVIAVPLLSKILDSSPPFGRPPGQVGMAPDEWHEWVHGNAAALVRVANLEYGRPNVLTFIG